MKQKVNMQVTLERMIDAGYTRDDVVQAVGDGFDAIMALRAAKKEQLGRERAKARLQEIGRGIAWLRGKL